MKELINRELLTEIYGFEILRLKRLDDIRILHTEFNGWLVECKDSNNDFLITSLTQISNQGKKWAESKGYTLMEFGYVIYIIPDNFDSDYVDLSEFNSFFNIEKYKSILKACQWIYDREIKEK